jgi:hypothetical protein
MKRGETIDIRNGKVDTPFDKAAEERGVVVENAEVCEGLVTIVRRRNDLMEVRSCLKATERIH